MASETLFSNPTGSFVCYRIHSPALVRSVETKRRWRRRHFLYDRRPYYPIWTLNTFFRRVENGTTTIRDAKKIRQFAQRMLTQ